MQTVARRMLVTLFGLAVLAQTGSAAGPAARTSAADAGRIAALVEEMRTADLSALPAITLTKFHLPPAGVDVMRVRIEETYDVAGLGRDTVELTGWIAARHDNARAAPGQTEVRWGTAIVDTEFVGLELEGRSDVFGPVKVHLNTESPSNGQVGNISIPFPVQIGLERAYGGLRAPVAVPTVQQPPPPPAGVTGADARQVYQVMQRLWEAIGKRDANAMSRVYSKSGDNLFFGTPGTGVHKGLEDYTKAVQKQFEAVKTIEVVPDTKNMDIKVFGRFAVVAVTGRNNVVDTDDRKASNEWRSTVRMAKTGNQWLITHDHTSFGPQASGNIANLGGKCLAKIRVNVEMPNLALQMKTDSPVLWYRKSRRSRPSGTPHRSATLRPRCPETDVCSRR